MEVLPRTLYSVLGFSADELAQTLGTLGGVGLVAVLVAGAAPRCVTEGDEVVSLVLRHGRLVHGSGGKARVRLTIGVYHKWGRGREGADGT